MSRGGKNGASYKGLVRKLFVIAFVAVNVFSIALMPVSPALAASFTFTQNDWAASADTGATSGHTGGAAQTGVTSFYSTSSAFLTTGTDLTVATSSGSFLQTNWAGEVTANNASHLSDQTGWTQFSATSTVVSAGADLALSQSSYTATDDGTFSTTGGATGGTFGAGTNSNTAMSGSGTGASVGLAAVPIDVGAGENGVLDLSSACTGTGISGTYPNCVITTTSFPSGFNYTSVNIPATPSYVTLTATGANPLIINATGNVTIAGTLSLNGSAGANYDAGRMGGAAGAGGAAGGAGSGYAGGGGGGSTAGGTGGTSVIGGSGGGSGGGGGGSGSSNGTSGRGGGGGGYAGDGGYAGGGLGSGGAGGGTYTTASVGSGGGGGGARDNQASHYGSGGGGGGGYLKIVSNGSINNTGIIQANGGAAGSTLNGHGGGGGSGGRINLISAITINNSGTLRANGGAGGSNSSATGSGGGGGGGGRIVLQDGDGVISGGTITAAGGSGGSGGGFTDNYGVLFWWGNGDSGVSASPDIQGLTHFSSGTFTSTAINLGAPSGFTGKTLAWSETLNGGSITMQVRAADNIAMSSGLVDWQSISNGGLLSGLANSIQGKQYIQYKAVLTSPSPYTTTPSLNSVTINYTQYPISAQLTSSAYNTLDSSVVGSISWTESGVSGSEDIKFQIRTAPDSSGAPGTWTDWLGPTGMGDYYTNQGETIHTTHRDGSGDQWVQYKVFMTSGGGATPTLSDVTVAYVRALDSTNGYTLISSPYNADSSANVIGDIRMNVSTLPSGTSAKIQVRTAATSGGLSASTWCGPTDCAGSSYWTATGTGLNTFSTIPSALTSGDDDPWFQYRITLIPSSDYLNAPYAASASVTYVVNIAPTVTNVAATTAAITQGSPDANAGKVTVTYDLTDDASETTDIYEAYLFYDVGATLTSDNTTTLTVSDTSRMPSAPGYVQIGTEVIKYASIINGTTLGSLTRGTADNSWPGSAARHTKAYTSGTAVWIKASGTTGDTGSVTKGTGKSITWDQRSEAQLANYSNYTAKVRVLVHDSNLANQLSSQSGSSADSSANVIIDNVAPTLSFTFDAGVAGETDSATVSMSTTGDATSTAQYMIADDAASHSTASSTPWTTFATPGSSAWTFDADFEVKTVKVQVRDPYGNAAATSTASTIMPAASSAFLVQDVSKLGTTDWRLFVGWETATSSDFASYKIEYATSTDNIIFSSYANATTPISSISTNYYVHQNLTTTWYYRYRLGVTATNGNTSIRSNASTTAKPDGAVNLGEGGGGNDITAPTVTNAASSLVKATSATVSFNAADGATSVTNAAVYIATQTDFTTNVGNGKVDRERYTSKIGNPGYITIANSTPASHSIALSNLTKNIQYRYAVESCDATGNCQFEDASDAGYTFTTQNGPAIVSGSIVATPAFDSASITWKTDKASDSIVFYSTSSSLANPISVGSNSQVTSADGNGQYVHTVTVPSLTYSATYYYKVRSTDQNAASDSYTQYDESTIRSLATTTQTPPTITTAAACSTTSSTATITWTTDQFSTTELSLLSSNVPANYFSETPGAQVAQYPSGTINSASRAVAGFVTAHSNTFTGLTETTTYYAKVRSLNASGGEVFATLSCATPAKDVVTLGRTIVEVGDITPPLIASLVIKDIKATSATIAWGTDEAADSLVKYGVTMKYGGLGGSEELSSDHVVTVSGLNPQTAYNFKVTSADVRGNRAYAGDQTFTTLSVQEEALLAKEDLESLKKELELLRGKAKTQESLQDAVQRFKAILKTVSTDVSLQDLEEITTEITDTISEITQEIVPPAIIGGVPQVDVEANKATVTWRTNKLAGSIIALVPQDEYNPNAKEPYSMQVGQPQEEVTTHTVTVPNLEPATTYHFQIRSQAKVGPEGKSRDFVFETKPELPQILDYSFKRITENSITVAWKTNTLSNSQVRYTPFVDGDLVNSEAKSQGKPEFVRDHEVTVVNLPSNTNFLIEIASADVTDATASKVIGTIRTTVDEKAPTITKARSESTIFPGKTERTQTLIYWETDEPSTSQIFWKEGVGKGDLADFSKLDKEYTTSHVMVLTNFKPGAVYRFQVESADPSNNKGRSTDFTILTPKKGETVIDLIITNFQDIFGFLKQL